MARRERGDLSITALADATARAEVVELLAAAEEISESEAAERLRNLPYLLRQDMTTDEAEEIADYLRGIGAQTAFSPRGKKGRPRRSSSAKPGKNAPRRISARQHLFFPILLFLLAAALVWWIISKQ